MKNNGKIVFLIILLSIMVFGLTIFMVHTINHGFNYNIGNFMQKESQVILEKKFEITDDLKYLSITEEYGDIIFKEATTNDISLVMYGDPKNTEYGADVKDGTLNIFQKNKNKVSFFNFKNYESKIELTAPKDFWEKINIQSDYGDCKLGNLDKAIINIDIDYGDVEIGKVSTINIKSDYGDINIEEVLNKCTIKSDYGDTKIENLNIKENSDIRTDYGDVKIKNTNDINIEADVDLGDKKVNNSNRKSDITLKINCDMGDVEVN